jgi:DeoR/GlpR family transcriptional regulator of sugar metabolism
VLQEQRQAYILAQLKEKGEVLTRQTCHELGVSEDTLRRDLRALAAAGLLQRVHGGGLPASPAAANLAERRARDEKIGQGEKQQLVAALLPLIKPGQVVFLDGGTTTELLAHSIAPQMQCTIITHSPTIMLALVEKPLIDVMMIGGRLDRHSVVAMGAGASEAIARLRCDLYIMGATGVHEEHGITTGQWEEASLKRQIASRAAETYLPATTEKLGAVSAYAIAPLAVLTALILPRQTPAIQQQRYHEAGVNLIPA